MENNSNSAVVRVEGLRKRYGDLDALRGITFEIKAGEVFGLLGPNGAGKTTAIEILEGLRQGRQRHGHGMRHGPWARANSPQGAHRRATPSHGAARQDPGGRSPCRCFRGWIQRFAAFLPATYLVSSFQAIMVGGQSLFEHKAEMLVLLTSGTFGLLFAWKLFRWEEEEKISSRAKLVSLTFIMPFLVMGIWMNEYGNLAKTWEETYSLTSHAPLAAGRHASPVESVLLNDFESPEEPEILLKTWQVTTDVSAAGRSLGEFEVISPGADRGYVTARFPFTLPTGATGWRGIQFEVRGDTRLFQVKIAPSDLTLPAPTLTFIPDSEWQSVRLPAAWLAASSPSPHKNTLTLEFRADGPPGDFKLDIDEIRFY